MRKLQLGGHNEYSNLVKYALVDDDVYPLLSKYKWSVYPARSTFYAYRKVCGKNGEKRTQIRMHRMILEVKDGRLVDHINGNGLDNRRNNLRMCTTSQNAFNRGIPMTNMSGYKGVSFEQQTKKWRAQICINGKRIKIGRFEDKKQAAIAYQEYAKKYHGEFYNAKTFSKVY